MVDSEEKNICVSVLEPLVQKIWRDFFHLYYSTNRSEHYCVLCDRVCIQGENSLIDHNWISAVIMFSIIFMWPFPQKIECRRTSQTNHFSLLLSCKVRHHWSKKAYNALTLFHSPKKMCITGSLVKPHSGIAYYNDTSRNIGITALLPFCLVTSTNAFSTLDCQLTRKI